jgi:hypothetical protein
MNLLFKFIPFTTVETGGIIGTFLSDATNGPLLLDDGVELDCFRIDNLSIFCWNKRSYWYDVTGL